MFTCASALRLAPLRAMRAPARTIASPMMVDIPRITLPDAIGDVLKEQDLSNPNDMGTDAYNSYSAAAIGGTLIFFILPLFDIAGFFGDFVLSALTGGGVAAYAALRKDTAGEYANKFGGYVMQAIDKGVPAAKEAATKLVDQVKDATK